MNEELREALRLLKDLYDIQNYDPVNGIYENEYVELMYNVSQFLNIYKK